MSFSTLLIVVCNKIQIFFKYKNVPNNIIKFMRNVANKQQT